MNDEKDRRNSLSSQASLNSAQRMETNDVKDLPRRICIVGKNLRNVEITAICQAFDLPVVCSDTGTEYLNCSEYDTTFVLQEFEGPVYETLLDNGCRILGVTALCQLADLKKDLPYNTRPLYCFSMHHLIISFTGFRKKEDMTSIATLIHHMGGSIRKEFNTKLTHVVAQATFGDKYRYAASMGIPIMNEQWVYEAWERRHDKNSLATDEALMQLGRKLFLNGKLAFLGFKPEDQTDMEKLTVDNGGEVVQPLDPLCTHFIVEDNAVQPVELPYPLGSRVYIVKAEWFWASIQLAALADTKMYAYIQQEPKTPKIARTEQRSLSASRGHKRKRLTDSVAQQLGLDGAVDQFTARGHKRSSSDLTCLSVSSSFLDAMFTPDTPKENLPACKDNGPKQPSKSARQLVCMELLQTETNYVGILHTVVTVFKEPLEEPDPLGGALLNQTEIKMIFGNLPPIYEVHTKMRDELLCLLTNWNESSSIGNVIFQHAEELLKAYPPFVNFFEKSKETLLHCDTTKPRFHAFLKRCQSKPECGRQSLVELLIRPVQRLPSVILLLNEISKNTPKDNPDHAALEKAIGALKEVMMHINEDKRKTEGQVAMFEIVRNIESCPPNLLSSHRNFTTKVEMLEISDGVCGRGSTIAMFLFSDVLEICKKRSKAVRSFKSPSTTNLAKVCHKGFKHLDLVSLTHIKLVADIQDTEDNRNAFALVIRSNQELKEHLYVFSLLDEYNKEQFLTTLCRHIAHNVCQADPEKFFLSLEPHQLSLERSDFSSSSLSRAAKIANKTRAKLGRALSMKRTTPSKLSHAVSSLISPRWTRSESVSEMGRGWMGSVTSLVNLGSATTGNGSVPPSPVFRKRKSSSFGASSTKFL